MKNENDSKSPLARIFGGALMLAGAATLMVSPIIVGSNPIPEGVLVFGLVTMLGGWVLTVLGVKKPGAAHQPSMGD
jgi:protein-S-isoprenylcysteine O-methyltransferase Ste14